MQIKTFLWCDLSGFFDIRQSIVMLITKINSARITDIGQTCIIPVFIYCNELWLAKQGVYDTGKAMSMMITASQIPAYFGGFLFFILAYVSQYPVLNNTSIECIDTRTFNVLKIRLKKNNFLIIQDKTKLIHIFYCLRATDL